jgi:2-keto-4-pentenoate hydratase/2-oxohepta-3-ene-1,7-dioic acid hydratase in catechol pathway
MARLPICLALALITIQAQQVLLAQEQPARPFKLGTFEHAGRIFVGIVTSDETVIDFVTANAAVGGPDAGQPAPDDMKGLIAQYGSGARERIVRIIEAVERAQRDMRPAYVYDLGAVKVLPPIMYPTTILNAAVNYRAHGEEMEAVRDAGSATPGLAPPGTASMPGIWERAPDDVRWNPYLFLKSPAAVIGHREAIRLPPGRAQIDWECELGVVIGRETSRVLPEEAAGYIFGYTIQNDVSDREGRGDTRYGSDWLIGKSHGTFAPLGPFVVPKEFVPDPQNLEIQFTLNGEVMQHANTSQMIHDVFELVAYASSIVTLRPGDVIAAGTPAGVGSARNPPVFLQHEDRSACTYEGVGTLENPVERP